MLTKYSIEAPKDFVYPKPEGINKMFEYARTLSKPFTFARADFYLINSQVIFGELTFVPGARFDSMRLPETDVLLGDLQELEK